MTFPPSEWRYIPHTAKWKAASSLASDDQVSVFFCIFGQPWASMHIHLPGLQNGWILIGTRDVRILKKKVSVSRSLSILCSSCEHQRSERTSLNGSSVHWNVCLFDNIPQLKLWGSPNVGWEGSVCGRFPTNVCLVSHMQVQCYPLLRLLDALRFHRFL